jgi:hypothetical protein
MKKTATRKSGVAMVRGTFPLIREPFYHIAGAKVLISCITGEVLLGRFHFSGFGVNQELLAETKSI